MKQIDDTVQAVLKEIEEHRQEIVRTPVPYRIVPVPAKKRWKMRYKRWVKTLRRWNYKLNRKSYIVE